MGTVMNAGSDRSPVGWRSLLVGMAGVVFICGLTPYNDHVIYNTFLIGNFFPVGMAAFFITFVLLINGPLWKWAPGQALTSGELAVAFGMALVSCAIPGAGLMWYWPGFLVAPAYFSGQDAGIATMLRELDLPRWMFPRFESADLVAQANEPVVTDFYARTPVEEPTMGARAAAVPWRAWVMPALTWGAMLAALWGAVLCLSVIVRRQWIENERLTFPLGMIYLSLIEQPERGRLLNRMFRSRGFAIAFAAVFIIHSFNALSVYYPQFVPRVPTSFNLSGVLSNEPWVYTAWHFKQQSLFFSIIGITFFVQTKVAFSIWFFYLLLQGLNVSYRMQGAEFTRGMQMDQVFGGIVVFVGMMLWAGRQQWMLVMRQMWRGARADEPQDRYLPYRLAGWGLVVCVAGMCAWLVAAGMTVAGAAVLVLMLLTIYLVLARVVAETGLFFVQIQLLLHRPWVLALQALPGEIRTTTTSYFYTTFFNGMLGHDTREALPVYSTHALRVADEAAYPERTPWRRGIWFMAALAAAMVVGYVVAGGSMLYVQYSYAATLDERPVSPINTYGTIDAPRQQFLDPLREYVPPRRGPHEVHSQAGHVTTGAVVMGVLSVLRRVSMHWPLHPIGYLLMYSPAVTRIWFSILLGWMCKALIVRFGGVEMFRRAAYFFMGLILGEAGASAFWLMASLVLNTMGQPYYPIRLMPGS
jgi:hypothetical protein